MAFPLRCTVRGCSNELIRNERGLTCDAGHHFDRAKEGYWNLLQPQDRKSKNPGDCDAAVLARQQWLRRGYHLGLVDAIRPWVAAFDGDQTARTMDLGCGEGTFGAALFSDESSGYVGVDLSKRAIKLAARLWRDPTWVLANADRFLPASDASVDRVVSLFGRRPASEISRVLAADGVCVVAVPGEDDLIELREQTQATGRRRNRLGGVTDELNAAGLVLVEHQTWTETAVLDPDAIADAMAMTYRAVRFSQQALLAKDGPVEVTLSADLLLFRRAATVAKSIDVDC